MTAESAALVPTTALVRRYVNRHLSVSRLKLFEQCPSAFEKRYIEKAKPPEGLATTAADFGTVLHEALESLYGWVVREEYSGRIPEDKLLEFYREAWTKSGLSGAPLYQEGLSILRSYIRLYPDVDHLQILATEQEFNISLGEFVINGYIDRVDKVDDETIAIVDYKSNRVLFSREEIDADLQMSIYALAARELWPWAKKVRFIFHMLRHGIPLETERTQDHLDDAASYVLATGRQSETGIDVTPHDAEPDAPRVFAYPTRLNTNCGYCDHRYVCKAYESAIARLDAIVVSTPEGLEDVARMREKIMVAIKVLDGKKRELEEPIRAALNKVDEITLGEVVYKLVPWTSSTSYPLPDVLTLLEKLPDDEGLPAYTAQEIREKVLVLDTKALDRFMEDAVTRVPRPKLILARLELDALKVTTAGAPRLFAHTLKGPSKPALPKSPPTPEPLALPASAVAPGEASERVDPVVVAPEPVTSGKGEPTAKEGEAKVDDGKWHGRTKAKKEPWSCPCGFKGHGKAIASHRETCTQAPPKGERTVKQLRGKAKEAAEAQEEA